MPRGIATTRTCAQRFRATAKMKPAAPSRSVVPEGTMFWMSTAGPVSRITVLPRTKPLAEAIDSNDASLTN